MGEKNPKNIYIYFSSSISQEVSEAWMEGEGEGTQKEKEERGEEERKKIPTSKDM